MISRHRALDRGVVERDSRREGAHAAGVRPLIAVEGALVVLGRAENKRGPAVAQREEARFLACEEFLDHDLGRGGAEAPAQHASIAAFASGRFRR